MKEKTSRIAEQSKKWLVEALFDLMNEKPYSTISVKEIADKAQLSRRTFYRNFKVKEDLLSQYVMYLFEDYSNCIKKLNRINIYDVLITYFKFWNMHIEELELLKNNHLFYVIMEYSAAFIPDINNIKEVEWHDYSSTVEEEYVSLFTMGGLWNVLSKWIGEKERRAPDEMAKIVIKAFGNFSKAISSIDI